MRGRLKIIKAATINYYIQVARELGSLRSLRKAFLNEMSRKLIKNTEFGDVINSIHPSKVKFLEANLEQLTSAHKALVRENYELKSQAPRMEGKNTFPNFRCPHWINGHFSSSYGNNESMQTSGACYKRTKRYYSKLRKWRSYVRI